MNQNADRLRSVRHGESGPAGPDAAEFAAMIEQSSLGTPAARALRRRIERETAGAVVDRAEGPAGGLTESDLAATWHKQLLRWVTEAVAAGAAEPNAMVLATANADGVPSSRTVLCTDVDERGLVFFTSDRSPKSHDLTGTRFASATFPWYTLHRQVTVRGTVEKVGDEETARYWEVQPRGSQLSAWASPQSTAVSGRPALDAALANVSRRFADTEAVPVPPHWSGWRIRPEEVEFWQGRADRLHDRLRYKLFRDTWRVERLGS